MLSVDDIDLRHMGKAEDAKQAMYADVSWAEFVPLMVGEVSNDLLRKDLMNFSVTWYWLCHASFRIMVDIMFCTMADEDTS